MRLELRLWLGMTAMLSLSYRRRNNMGNFISKLRYRWTVAPTWVKVLDITCWAALLIFVGLAAL